MIARIWRGRVKPGLLEEYRAFLERTGLRDYRATPGNVAAYALASDRGEYGEIITLSLWESKEAIAAFAGEDINVPRYYPEDPQYLLELHDIVEHYDVTLAEKAL